MIRKCVVVASVCLFTLGCARSPELIPSAELARSAKADIGELGMVAEPITAPLSLYDAMARAIKYNREKRLALMETVLAGRQLDASAYDLLPSLTVNAGYTQRDNYAATASVPFTNDRPEALPASPNYSISQDKQRNSASASFSWNILDFGLSYVRAGQQADRYLIAQERRRKVIHNIAREVRAAYWKALAADNLLSDLAPLLNRVEKALENSREIERKRLSSPTDALIYQKELLEIRRTLHSQQRVLMTARLELGQLMGLLPGHGFKLREPEYIIPEVAMNMSLMERTALAIRPELMEVRYQERLSRREVRAAMFSMLPSLTLNANYSYDDSDYAKYEDAVELGASASYNLLSAFSGPKARDVAKAQVDLAAAQRMALSIAVISQVHISNMNYAQSRREYEVAERYLSVSKRLTQQTKDAQRVAKFGELEVIRQEASLLLARMRRDIAFAELQNSHGAIYASIGMDVLPETIESHSVDSISKAIAANLRNWRQKYAGVEESADSELARPIETQSPVLTGGQFAFAADTFRLSGKIVYSATQQDGSNLPTWLRFEPEQRLFTGTAPREMSSISIRVIAQSANERISDNFVLRLDHSTKKPVAAVAKPRQAVQAKATPKSKVAPAVKPKANTTASAVASYFVQAKALSSYQDAKNFRDRLANLTGLDVFVRKTKKRSPPLYRVIIPAMSRGDIAPIQSKLRGVDITDAFVTRQ